MGHDIDLVDDGVIVASTYISFNWSCFSKLFHIGDIHGHDNGDGRISRRLSRALKRLEVAGFEPRNDMRVDRWGVWKRGVHIPLVHGLHVNLRHVNLRHDISFLAFPAVVSHVQDDQVYVWRYLNDTKAKAGQVDKSVDPTPFPIKDVTPQCDFTSPDCHCMFAWILQGFLQLANKHPHATWISDQCHVVSDSLHWPLPSLEPFNLCDQGDKDDDDKDDSDHDDDDDDNQNADLDVMGNLCDLTTVSDALVSDALTDEEDGEHQQQVELSLLVTRATRVGPLHWLPPYIFGHRCGVGYVAMTNQTSDLEVSSYRDAMQLHLHYIMLGDLNLSKAWFQVAIQLPDCPRFIQEGVMAGRRVTPQLVDRPN